MGSCIIIHCKSFCDCQAYAGFYFIARAMLVSNMSEDTFSSELDEFKSAVETFCQTHWTVVSVPNLHTDTV